MGIFDPFDWNGNGKHDIFDDMLEFVIFEAITKKDDTNDDDFDFGDDCDLNFDD